MPRLIKTAIVCGAIPLVAGTVIYSAWRLTRAESLELLGLFNIFIGLVLFVVGMGCLILQSSVERRSNGTGPHGKRLRNALVAGLLLFNFPAAIAYGLSAIEVMSCFTVRIVNNSEVDIDSIEIKGIGFERVVDPMPAGSRTRLYIHEHGEGAAGFTARHGNSVVQGELSGYVTEGEDITLRFMPGGGFEVQSNYDVDYLARD